LDVAIEIFFEAQDIFMFGFRYSEKLGITQAGFMHTIVRVAQNAKHPLEFSELLMVLLENWLLPCDVSACSKIELGILDFWKSEGAFEIWRTDLPKVIANPFIVPKHLYENSKNVQLLEFSATTPMLHWVGLGVGKKENKIFRLNDLCLEDLLIQYGKLNFEINPEIEIAWMIEIKHQIKNIRSGKSQFFTQEEVFRQIELQKEQL
jgi:hypothetical protein